MMMIHDIVDIIDDERKHVGVGVKRGNSSEVLTNTNTNTNKKVRQH
jgi:hypothetical protein